jgi:predicted amidophosphoribosyltransferase
MAKGYKQFREKNPNWTGGQSKCVDCGKQLVGYRAKRCWDCHLKLNHRGENNGSWKGGKPKCPDCGKVISYYAKKCKSCCSKGQPKRGRPFTTEERRRGGLASSMKLHERKPTNIEIKVYEALKEKGFLFEKQKIMLLFLH